MNNAGGMTKESEARGVLSLWLSKDEALALSAHLAITKSKVREPFRRHLHLVHVNVDAALCGADQKPGSGGSRYRGEEGLG